MMYLLIATGLLVASVQGGCPQALLSPDEQEDFVSRGGYQKAVVATVSSFKQRFVSWSKSYQVRDDDVVVFDIDETLLSNISYLRQVHYKPTTEGFYAYLSSAKAVEIPEVVALMRWLQTSGYGVVLLTGRPARFYDITKQQLQSIGLLKGRVELYCNNTDLKTVAYKKHIFEQLKLQNRRVIMHATDQCAEVWPGQSKWVLRLPNPFYQVAS